MCVHLLTTSAMSSSSTSSFSMPLALLQLGEPRLLLLDLLSRAAGTRAVLQLGRLRVVAGALRALDLAACTASSCSLQLRATAESLPSPAASARRRLRLLFLEIGELLLELRQPLARRLVLLLAQRLALDLELHDAALDLVELGRHRVDLHAQLRRRLVHQVDGLVGQEPIGDVAVRQHRRRDQRRVLELHL